MFATFSLNDNLVAIVVLITTGTTAIVTVLDAFFSNRNAKRLHERATHQEQVLTKIASQTDGALTQMQAEARAAQERADALQQAISAIINRSRKDDGPNGTPSG